MKAVKPPRHDALRAVDGLLRSLREVAEQQRRVCATVGALGEREDLPAPAYAALDEVAGDLGAQVLALLAVVDRVAALSQVILDKGSE